MKKIISGASILLAGSILFLSAFIATSNIFAPIASVSASYDRFWVMFSDTKISIVLVVSIITMIAGIALILWGNHESDKRRK